MPGISKVRRGGLALCKFGAVWIWHLVDFVPYGSGDLESFAS